MTSLWVVLPTRSAEDAVRAAVSTAGRAGVVVTPALLAGPGAPVVAALAAVAPVLVLAGLHGEADDAALAARRYVEYGAAVVTVHADGGPALMGAVTGEIGGDRTMAVTLWPGIDDAATAGARLGTSRGKVVSRLAANAAQSGVGSVLCEPADLGVIHQVAPHLARYAWGVTTPEEAAAAADRGAAALVLPVSVLTGRNPAGLLDEFIGRIGAGG